MPKSSPSSAVYLECLFGAVWQLDSVLMSNLPIFLLHLLYYSSSLSSNTWNRPIECRLGVNLLRNSILHKFYRVEVSYIFERHRAGRAIFPLYLDFPAFGSSNGDLVPIVGPCESLFFVDGIRTVLVATNFLEHCLHVAFIVDLCI